MATLNTVLLFLPKKTVLLFVSLQFVFVHDGRVSRIVLFATARQIFNSKFIDDLRNFQSTTISVTVE